MHVMSCGFVLVKFIDVIVWPALVAGIIFFFKDQIRFFLERITKIENKFFSLELQRVRKSVDEYAVSVIDTKISDEKAEQLRNLAAVNPACAITDAWREVELSSISAALYKKLHVRGPKGWVSGGAAINKLLESGVVSEKEKFIYNNLKELRKTAIDSFSIISTADAVNYINLALEFAAVLRSIK